MKAPKNNVCRARPFELRADKAGDGFTLEGYAAVFDSPTRIDSWEGTFDETLARGAFAKTIGERMPVLQFDHGHDARTGSVPIGAIEKLSEDDHGLFVRARLHDNATVEPIRQAIASGAIDGMSFRFRVLREEWDETADVPARSIREVDLFELGPVVFPAYAATSVGVRSMLADLTEEQRGQIVQELVTELSRTESPDADLEVTSEETTPTPAAATSGSTPSTYASRQQFKRRLIADSLGILKG